MSILDRSESRDGAQVIWLAVHSTEGDDNPLADDARALRDATWWEGSSHAIADDEPGTLLTPAQGCVPYERAAWTLRGGNHYSDNIELVARASWSRVVWLANPRLLEFCAQWLADGHKRRPWIPLRRLSLAEVRAHVPGVIGHVDYTNATGDGSHWDPGPGFPWDVVLARANAIANGEEDDMPYSEDQIVALVQKGVRTALIDKTTVAAIGPADFQNMLRRAIDDTFTGKEHAAETRRMLGVILGWRAPATDGERAAVEKLWGGAVDVDEKAVAASLTELIRPFLLEAVRAGMSADNDAQADVIVDRLAQRLGSAT